MARKRTTEHTEATSVEETIENADGIEAGAEGAVAPVQSTTEETPSAADESSAPGPYQGDDAPKPEDPPVRAAKPDTPIAQVLVEGAGAHTPPDPDEFDKEGRPRRPETEAMQEAAPSTDEDDD